jgi:hypothetical protein
MDFEIFRIATVFFSPTLFSLCLIRRGRQSIMANLGSVLGAYVEDDCGSSSDEELAGMGV